MRRGSNVVELALTLPVFVLLLSALVDFGWYFFGVAMGEMAVHRGCRVGATVDPILGDPEEQAVPEMDAWLGTMGISCGVADCQTRHEGEIPAVYLVCEVRWDHAALLGLAPTPVEIHRLASVHQNIQRH